MEPSYSKLEVHYHSVRISGASITAEQLFDKMRRFTKRDLGPVSAHGDLSSVGQAVAFTMNSWFHFAGQATFEVEVIRLDHAQREVVVQTVAGHPLAGYRYWGVDRVNGGDLIIRTFSVEHPATPLDWFKVHTMGGIDGMYQTWESLLNDLASLSGGQIVWGPDTELKGREEFDIDRYYQKVRK